MEATTTAGLEQEEEERWKLARKAPHLHSHTAHTPTHEERERGGGRGGAYYANN